MPAILLCVFRFVRLLFSGHQAVAVENLALRLQLAAFKRKRKRPVLTQGDRLFWLWPLISRVQFEKRVLTGAPPFVMGPEPVGMWLYRAYGVPWRKDDINERLKALTKAEYEALDLFEPI